MTAEKSYNLDHLLLVGELDAGEAYEVDSFLVEYDPEKRVFYWVAGQGCSCWDGYGIYSEADYDGNGTAQEAHSAVDAWATEWDYRKNRTSPGDIADLHNDIANA